MESSCFYVKIIRDETCGAAATHLYQGMGKVRDMLIEQREAVLRLYRPLEEEIKSLRFELHGKQRDLMALAAEAERINRAIAAVEKEDVAAYISIMDAVMAVLQDRPEGMTANEILAEINTRYFGGTIVRSSLSPQLSRLKNRDGKIELRGKKWFALPAEPNLFAPKE